MSSIAQIGSVPASLIPRLQQRLEKGLEELRRLLPTLGPQIKPEQIHDIRIATRRQRVLCRLLELPGTSPGFEPRPTAT
jgi:CHAD domain-containing protein